MIRILGIDPGSQRTGIGVIDVAADGRCTFVHAQALVLLDAEDFPSRLGLLCDGLEALLDQWQPQQVAIELNLGAGRRLDGPHGYAPKLLIAAASSAWISRKFWAPVIVSMVSTRFWTPESFSTPPAAVAWR